MLLLACGTSWHASPSEVPDRADGATTGRGRYGANSATGPRCSEATLAIGVSQSGETADTVAALQEARRQGASLGAIVNVPGSQIARMAEGVWPTHAGPEIGVASTKAFTTQLLVFFLIAARLREARGIRKGLTREEISALARLPGLMEKALRREARIEALARKLSHYRDFLYLGRGMHYPIALEGALKLKEISYIHAEGYPAGEMKHGPIALISRRCPSSSSPPRRLAGEDDLESAK